MLLIQDVLNLYDDRWICIQSSFYVRFWCAELGFWAVCFKELLTTNFDRYSLTFATLIQYFIFVPAESTLTVFGYKVTNKTFKVLMAVLVRISNFLFR